MLLAPNKCKELMVIVLEMYTYHSETHIWMIHWKVTNTHVQNIKYAIRKKGNLWKKQLIRLDMVGVPELAIVGECLRNFNLQGDLT